MLNQQKQIKKKKKKKKKVKGTNQGEGTVDKRI